MTISLDFNHGATLPATDIRAGDISDRINAHIDAAFYAKRAAEPKRDYVGASAIGNSCLRAIQYGYIHMPIDEGRLTGKTLRIFDAGHTWEARIAEWMQMAGFQLETLNPATGKQHGFSVMGGKGKGHIDGKVISGPIPMEYPYLWECKALNEKSWQDVKKRGLAVSKPIYMAQVAIDQAYLNLTAPAIFTALNKNTEEIYHELVPFDRALAQQMSDKMAQIITATEQQTLLPRGHANADYFECQWCDFRRTCWKL